MSDKTPVSAVELTAQVTIAWLSNQNVRVAPDDVPGFLRSIHQTVIDLASKEVGGGDGGGGTELAASDDNHAPAVSVRKSLASRDHIISMIDGKPYKSLRRHLSRHGLTPDQYRRRYGLKPDYPMVAPSYSEARREMAKKIGLGQKRRSGKGGAAANGGEGSRSTRRRRAGSGPATRS